MEYNFRWEGLGVWTVEDTKLQASGTFGAKKKTNSSIMVLTKLNNHIRSLVISCDFRTSIGSIDLWCPGTPRSGGGLWESGANAQPDAGAPGGSGQYNLTQGFEEASGNSQAVSFSELAELY